MKVKIVKSDDVLKLENSINHDIESLEKSGAKVIGLKYGVVARATQNIEYSAMIIYESDINV